MQLQNPQPSHALSIAVVGRDRTGVEAASVSLAAAGHPVQAFHGDPASVLARLQPADLPDCVVVVRDGFTAALRAVPGVPVVAVVQHDAAAALADGVDEVLTAEELTPTSLSRAATAAFARRRGSGEPPDEDLREERYRSALDALDDAPVGVARFDTERRCVRTNRPFLTVLGLDDQPWEGVDWLDVVHPGDRDRAREAADAVLAGTRQALALRGLRSDGAVIPQDVALVPYIARDGKQRGFRVFQRDVVVGREALARLAELARHDGLTGVPNRRTAEDRLITALAGAQKTREVVGVTILDVDHMRVINETAGRAAGDEALRALTQRLCAALPDGDEIARLGSDELLVMQRDVGDEQMAVACGRALVAALRAPLDTPLGRFSVSVSAGVALTRDGAATAGDLIADAEAALYLAKDRGGNRCELFDERVRTELWRGATLEADLASAIGTDRLQLLYEPIVVVGDGDVIAFECRFHWDHPELGLVGLDELKVAALRSGAVVPLGEWALREACEQITRWKAAGGTTWARVAIDIAPREVEDPRYARQLAALLEETGVEPYRIGLELGEMAFAGHAEPAVTETLRELRRMGVILNLDHLGTGHSRLADVRANSFTSIKVDARLVADLAGEVETLPVIEALATMARSLGLALIATDVATDAQLAALVDLGFGLVQGPLIGAALSAGGVAAWVVEDRVRRERDRDAAPAHGRTVGLGEAATALGVSPSTVRRWIDDGRLPAERTSGGHRRIPFAAIRRMQQRPAAGVNVRRPLPPQAALPRLGDLLAARGEALACAVGKRLYGPPVPGWFGSEGAVAVLRIWAQRLGLACAAGDYAHVPELAHELMREARMQASLVECQLFGERLTLAVLQELARSDAGRKELPEARSVFAVVRTALLDPVDADE
jgi:diguanylate cyclase (GGDEF)-like protein/excisionase family DNA binding protein/PAS domain S-box-containing protein